MAVNGGRSSYSTTSSESTCSSGDGRVRTVILFRRAGPNKLGFSIRGGKEHGTGFFVTAIEPHSEAAKQGLLVGDQIIRINGFPVEDATHKEVLQLILGQNTINFKVKSVGMIPVKENPEDELSWQIVESMMITNGHPSELFKGELCEENSVLRSTVSDVRMVLKVPPRAKLGCGICKGPEWKPGVFIQFTKENSIARQAGLRPGDQILQCNNFVFTPETPFNEAVSVMRCSGMLELVVRKGAGLELFPGESSGYNSSASSVAGDHPPSKLSVLHEETSTNSCASDGAINGSDRSFDPHGRSGYSNGCTVIHVGGDETDNKKIAEICMVSQQLETKTTTVFVEVHHSEDDTVSNTQSEASTDRLTNSSSVSSFTSSASSLSSAISQELERRSKRSPGSQPVMKSLKQSDKLIKNGLAKEKVEQHEQLMLEFKKAHRKMFSSDSDSTVSEEREEQRLSQLKGAAVDNGIQNADKDAERPKGSKRHAAPPPPPPFPSSEEEKPAPREPVKGPSTKKHPPPAPPLQAQQPVSPSPPPYCPTPDYDSGSPLASRAEGGTAKRGDIVEMQSLESFKLTNPSKVKPKPPSVYFSRSQVASPDTSNGIGLTPSNNGQTGPLRDNTKPLVTIREYPGGKEKKNPAKFDFLQNMAPSGGCEEPITSRLHNELSQTLSRATVLTRSEQEANKFAQNGTINTVPNGQIPKGGTVVTINLSQSSTNGDTSSKQPFYLFPTNGNYMSGVDNKKLSNLINSAANKNTLVNGKVKPNGVVEPPQKNSVTFNFNGKAQEAARNGHVQKNGILKNANNNISQVQIQTQSTVEKVSTQKSIKFGGI